MIFRTSFSLWTSRLTGSLRSLWCVHYQGLYPGSAPRNPYQILACFLEWQDQSVYFISKCSVYIALVGLLRGDDKETIVQDVKTRLWPIVFRGWKFWPLAHIITYGVIPPRHRVLWVNMLDLLWSSILASLASNEAKPQPAKVVATAVEEVPKTQEEQQRLVMAADIERKDLM